MEKIISRDPSTGKTLKEIPTTPESELPGVFRRAEQSQRAWAQLSPKQRAKHLINLREVILNRVDELAELISKENGKPLFEALTNDLLPSVEAITYFAKRGPKLMKDKPIRIGNPILLARKSYLHHWPLGTIVIISPWNFPFFLPFGEIVMGLLAGNAIVFKPSEICPQVGLKIQELCEEAGLPENIIQTVVGGGKLGAALINQKPAKIFFTGSVETGKKVMAAASKHLIPVVLELGGKDAMIILRDADIDFATSAALWGAFGNSGQVCASTERILVHDSIYDAFMNQFRVKVEKLRHRKKGAQDFDLGSITMEKQKKVYESQLIEAESQGARIETGGTFSKDRSYLEPTVVSGDDLEALKVYQDESFGPIVSVRKYRSINDAIEKTNKSRYGLLASVITEDISLGEDIAKQLEVGTVTVNEVGYTAGLPETPWGGLKDSGFGLKHSDIGFMEFLNIRHINKPRANAFVFKSFWWYPYSTHQYETFRQFFELYRKSWFARIRAVPMFLMSFLQFMKKEKRL